MRVLVVATPMPGHVLPLVPLARALRDAGHAVTVATTGDALAACPDDLSPIDVVPGLRLLPLMLRFAARHPRLARAEAAGRGEPRTVGLLWGPVNERMADGVAALAAGTRPDVIVHEPFAVSAAAVAARHGVPSVVVEHSLFDAGKQADALAAAWPTAVPAPREVITTAPRSLVGPRAGRPMRFVGSAPQRPFAEEFAHTGSRPRVLVSRSTAADPRRDRLMTTVVEAAAGTELDVALVRPDRWVSRRPLPPNVRTTDWLPFPAVLPAAAGIVHHGGAGTVLTALAAGVPQIVVRGSGDRRVNAEVLAARGAGIAADLSDLSPALLERLVADASLTAAAREVAAEMAAMPHPSEVVPHLERLAARVPGR